jgi:MFS family permease
MLRRNRDFRLLQAGQLLSATGSQATTIAYPLLALALTGSAGRAGVVAFCGLAPFALFGLAAGVVADRHDRRRVMVTADALRAAAVGGLGAAVVAGSVAFWMLPVAAFVEGVGSAFFRPAALGALRSIVVEEDRDRAVVAVQARSAFVGVIGPPLGGVLFAIGRAVPFLFDCASYVGSIVSLAMMRAPFQELRGGEPVELREGMRFLWRSRFLRVTTFIYGLGNFLEPGLLLCLVIIGKRERLGSEEIGVLLAVFSLALFCGSLAAGRLRLPARVVLLLEPWTYVGCAVYLAWPSVYVLLAGMLPTAFAIPLTDAAVIAHRLRITPDRLIGRVEAARSTFALLIAPLGPLAAGLLLGVSERVAVGAFAAGGLALAISATVLMRT